MEIATLRNARAFFVFVKVLVTTAMTAVFLFMNSGTARAVISENAPPIEAFFESPLNVGGGAVFPYIQFRLSQSTGSDTLSKIGVQIFASTTINQGEISRVSLWQESGTKQGFQIDQDTFIAGAASTSPLVDGTLIVLTPATAVSIGASPTEFFIVASTTGGDYLAASALADEGLEAIRSIRDGAWNDFAFDQLGGHPIYFGANGYSDYTKHKDKERLERYIGRHKHNENWGKDGIKTAGFWSRWLLWNKPTIKKSVKDVERRFNIKIV